MVETPVLLASNFIGLLVYVFPLIHYFAIALFASFLDREENHEHF